MLLVLPDQGGAAEFVAQQLDVRLREHLRVRNNLLTEGTPGLSASLSRPLLCLFDRNFELSVVRQTLPIFHMLPYPPHVPQNAQTHKSALSGC